MTAAGRTLLLIGANGQVGWELRRTLAPLGTVIALDRTTLELTDLQAIRRVVITAKPDVLINAAAYTQVDRAESEVALAQRINVDAPRMMASTAKECGAVMIHYSTDYVFDGTATRPYRESDVTNPVNVYGRSKRDGDEAILETGVDAYLFRVGWVYGMRGRNFLRTVQRLMEERTPLRMVADQFGTPTWSRAIADATTVALRRLFDTRPGVTKPVRGVYHMAAPDSTTWAGFAQAIVAGAADTGARPHVAAITSEEHPTPARRPRWSVLDATLLRDTFGIQLASWREQLAACLADANAGALP